MGLTSITPDLVPPSKQGLSDEKKVKDMARLRYYTSFSLACAVAIGLLIAWRHEGTVSASIVAFGAALGLGGVLGFLFGIPGNARPAANRTRAAVVVKTPVDPLQGNANAPGDVAAAVSEPVPDSEDPGSTSRTSNLEQVADWVTKLLLGGGLTQMQRIPPKVWQWSRMVALGILKDDPKATEQIIVANQAFAAGLLVYGFILGFFAGFLITKLQLGNAISD